MIAGAIIMVLLTLGVFAFIALAVYRISGHDSADIAIQILKEHEEELKRQRQKRYE